MEDRNLMGQVAIVTGAGQGIGYEIASRLAGQGAAVLLNDLDGDLVAAAAERIRVAGGRCHPIRGDAGNIGFIQEMVDTAVREFGGLTIVVVNAGITLFGDFLHYPPESLEQVLRLNVQGSFFLAQRAARRMIEQEGGGRILFMSSVTGHQAHRDLVAYGMSKAALEMLAKGLVAELSGYGITVNSVAPGATLTERTLADAGYRETWSRITPMGRPGTVQDVANAVLFLASPGAGHITGQTLVVDGGWSAVSVPPA